MFGNTELDFGWASVQDCEDRLRSLQGYMNGEIGPVQRAIEAATGLARSYLRVRWPEGWPFTTVPSEIRGAVAALAVFGAMMGVGIDTASRDLVEGLRLEAKRAEAWLQQLGQGKVDLDLPRPADGSYLGQYAVAAAPGGEFGFSG
jgi:hypothetical protein